MGRFAKVGHAKLLKTGKSLTPLLARSGGPCGAAIGPELEAKRARNRWLHSARRGRRATSPSLPELVPRADSGVAHTARSTALNHLLRIATPRKSFGL